MGKSRPSGRVGNERLIIGLPPARCMFFWFNCAYNIIILYKKKGSPEVKVAVVNKLNIYIEI